VLRVDFITLFPEMILPSLEGSILGRAAKRGLAEFGTTNPRDYTYDRNHKVDDAPYGGEPGMLIKAEPIALAIESLPKNEKRAVVFTDPAGATFNQNAARDLTSYDQVVFLCGHYEGIDDRVRQLLCTHSFSIGDYVLTNGEMPALVMADAVVRLLPGVLGSAESLDADSHSDGLLGAPNYTRPESWRGISVPPVLLTGDHAKIEKWRRQKALALTLANRPDLLRTAELSAADLKLLAETGE